MRTLQTEIDSMESLVEVLHQNSMSLRDPQAIADELDTIVRQSEDSNRIVREMEALLRTDTDAWQGELAPAATLPPIPAKSSDADPGRPPEGEGPVTASFETYPALGPHAGPRHPGAAGQHVRAPRQHARSGARA